MLTLPQRKQISIDKVCDQSRFAVAGGLVGNRRDRVFRCTDRCSCLLRDTGDEGVDPRWPATCWDSYLDAGGLTICTLKTQLYFVERTRVRKSVAIERPRSGWEGPLIRKQRVIFNTAIEFSSLKKHAFVSLHYYYTTQHMPIFNAKEENVSPRATSSPDENDTFEFKLELERLMV